MKGMDPFEEVKREVTAQMEGIGGQPGLKGMFERWKTLSEEPAPKQGQIEEMAWMQSELQKGLRTVEWDLKDMNETIEIVMKQPSRFQIGEDELEKRISFVDMTTTQLGNMKSLLDRVTRRPPPRLNPTTEPGKATKGGYESLEIADAQALDEQVQEQFRQNDQQLDDIAPAVGRLQEMAGEMSNELQEQDVMINDLDKGVDGLRGNLNKAMNRLDKIASQMSNTKKLGIIALLVIVLVIMVVYTFAG